MTLSMKDAACVDHQRLAGNTVGFTERDHLLCDVVLIGSALQDGGVARPRPVFGGEVSRSARTFQITGCYTIHQNGWREAHRHPAPELNEPCLGDAVGDR